MTLLICIFLAIAALLFMGRKTREKMDRGTGETGVAIQRIRKEREKRYGRD